MASEVNHALLLYIGVKAKVFSESASPFFAVRAYKRYLSDNYEKVEFH